MLRVRFRSPRNDLDWVRVSLGPELLADEERFVRSRDTPESEARLEDLIESRVDGIEVARLREIFRYRRPPA